jgi:uncharacterized repeat protein (TIGR02543 family)
LGTKKRNEKDGFTMKRFFTRTAGFGNAMALFAALFAVAACSNPSGSEAPEQYTLTFESHGGSAVEAVTAEAGTAVNKPADPARSGYVFSDWFSAPSEGTRHAWPHTLTANITMHAQWQEDTEPPPVQYTLAFDSQGGSAVEALTADPGTELPQPADPAREGYVFKGWFSAASGGTAYAWPHTLSGNVTMYARWEAIPRHTLVFESHGGSAVEPVTVEAGTALAKPTDPTRDGYSFEGWFSAETGGTLYPWPHALSADLTMHARWQDDTLPEPKKHAITFESHGGTELEAITANEGTEVNKPTDPTRNAYAFSGWFDAETGGTAYAWPHALNVDVTMHAQWTAASYSISYHLNGGANPADPPASYTIESADITLPVPAKTGYAFDGWFDNSGFSGAAITTIVAGSSGNKTFYAKWSERYAITYVLNDPDAGNGGNPEYYTAESLPLTLKPPAKPGYAGSWHDNPALSGAVVTEIAAGTTGAKTFYAGNVWTPVNYAISYELNGGANPVDPPASYTIESNAITLPVPTRDSYTFGGWFENSGFTGTAVTTIPMGSAGDKTFYAQWWPDAPISISVWVNEDGEILVSNANVTISKSGTEYNHSFTATVTSDYTGVQWTLNGVPMAGNTASSITINAADYALKTYILGVIVTKDEIPYSNEIRFTVVN